MNGRNPRLSISKRMSLGIAEEVARVDSKSGFKPAKLREIEIRRRLAKRRDADPADMAYACADLGDKEQTFVWLDKALADKSGGLEVVKVVPSMDQWRSDSRSGIPRSGEDPRESFRFRATTHSDT